MAKEEVKFMAKPKRRRRRSSTTSPRPATKKKIKWSKWVWLFILGQLAGFVAIFSILEGQFNPETRGDNGIFITAAHLPESSIDKKYKLLYEDSKTDKAYYLDTTYAGPIIPAQGVSIKGISSAKIVTTQAGSFMVEVEDPQQIVGGLSGSRVYNLNGDRILGFVSSMQPGGKLLCIAVE